MTISTENKRQEKLRLPMAIPDKTAVYRCLGRPVSPFVAFRPDEVQEHVESLLRLCLRRQASGVPVAIGAGAWDEAALLHVVAIASVRLGILGIPVCICGSVYNSPEPPTRSHLGGAILLGASLYRRLGCWSRPKAGEITILVAQDGTAFPADLCLPPACPDLVKLKMEAYRAAMIEAIESETETLRLGMIASALGCDLPVSFFGDALPAPFVPVKDSFTGEVSAWATVQGGQFLAAEVLRDYIACKPAKLNAEKEALFARLTSLGAEGKRAAARLSASFTED